MPNKKSIPLQMEKLIARFQKQLSGNTIKCCDLGSCQYNTANIAYLFILSALQLSRPLFEQLFKITYDSERTESEFIASLKSIATDYYNENKDDPDWAAECRNHPDTVTSIDTFYDFEKNNSSDLWSSAINPLPGFQCDEQIHMPVAGPIFNQMAQSENWDVALAIAYTTFLYGTDISAFADFDT
jgi:hypothetical protein